jgi:hypothetical protein
VQVASSRRQRRQTRKEKIREVERTEWTVLRRVRDEKETDRPRVVVVGDLWRLLVAAGGPLAGAGRSETSGLWAHAALDMGRARGVE